MAETQTQSDPWVEAAKSYKPQAGGEAAPAQGNEDWKVWQQGGEEAPKPGFFKGVQNKFDEFTAPRMAPEGEGMGDRMERGVENVGRGIVQGAAGSFVHPLNTLKAAWNTSPPGALINAARGGDPNPMQGMVDSIMAHPEEGLESAAGNVAGGMMMGDAAEGAAGALGAAGRGGLDLGNSVLGARGPKPFKYGANPARGAFEEGVLPALSKHSAATKLESALPEVGQRISDKVMQGGSVPLGDIAKSIEGPTNQARSVIQGPGGGNRSIEPIDALVESMRNKAPGASRPIYGANAGTPFNAEEAAAAIASPGQRLLAAPKEDISLGETPYKPGRLSKPMIIEGNRPMPREWPAYGVNPPAMADIDLGDIPGEAGPMPSEPEPWGDRFNGMKFNEHVGGKPGTFGGGQPQGMLRRTMQFPESEEPSPFSNLTHPHATAPDVWRTIQNVDKNTRFNPDPEVEGVNELRREMRGGLRGNLEDAVPGLKPDSQRYGDLKSAEESLDRTMHSGDIPHRLMDAAKTPIASMLGKGMYEAGKAVPFVRGAAPFAPVAGLMQDLRKKEQ